MIGDILQPTHLLFVLVIALLVLGPKRLPEVGRALGRGIRDFRNAVSGDELHEALTSPLGESRPDETATEPAASGAEPAQSAAEPVPAVAEPVPAVAAPAPAAEAAQPDTSAATADKQPVS